MMYMQRKYSDSTSRDNSFTKSYEEDETSNLPDHSARQMQTSTDMITEDEIIAQVPHMNSSREDQNLGGSMNMEEHIPWPMSPSRVNPTAILPCLYENGTSSSGGVGVRPTLIETYTVI